MFSLSQRFERMMRHVVPFGIALALLLLGHLPALLGRAGFPAPHFALICVYYWSVYHPRAMPYWAAFLLGLLRDALYGLPPGLSSASLMLTRYVIGSQRRLFSQEAFLPLWLVFTIISFAIFAAEWSIMSFQRHLLLPLDETFAHWALSAAIYPLVHSLLNPIYATLPPPPRNAQ